jgi:very-short-patch-repair endonuclease
MCAISPAGAEVRLWQGLRMYPFNNIHFRRQHAIGPYIVDFCTPRQKIIIEVDGEQHLEQQEYDVERTAFLNTKGYQVLRFWNDEVINHIDQVLEAISARMGKVENVQSEPKTESP